MSGPKQYKTIAVRADEDERLCEDYARAMRQIGDLYAEADRLKSQIEAAAVIDGGAIQR